MKIKIAPFLFLTLFFFAILNYPVSVFASDESAESNNILILNSYHSGFTWTDEQNQGIISALNNSSVSAFVSSEYLDWKRYPTSENLSNLYQSLKYKYQNESLDVIICTDDMAFSFAAKYRKELFSNAPIVFCGINSQGLEKLSYGVENYTGVLEQIAPYDTLKAAKQINPDIDTVYLIFDNSESGLSTGALCIEAAKKLDQNLNIVSLNNLSSQEIIDKVSLADKNTVVLLTTYASDIHSHYISHEYFCRQLSQVSPVPLYHIYDFGMNHGVLGGFITSGVVQGESAGQLAVRILQGESASSIPIVTDNTNQYIFDYSLLEKYNISADTLPAGSKLINQPFSFFKTYRTLVISVSSFIALLILFTVILLFYIKKIRAMRTVLQSNNEELTQLYEELTASEEEIRSQFRSLEDAHLQLEENNDKLYYLAHHDTLTGLKNRLYLYKEIEKQLTESMMNSALFFIDIDNFKFVNDSLGHNIGDELLIQISNRLNSVNTKHRCLARLGGDEFVYFVREIQTKDAAYEFASSILEHFNTPFNIEENALVITVSIGIALFPENGNNVDTLLRNADMAMYKVKNNGKNGISFFSQLIKEELLERINIEKYFDKALRENEFLLYYQPQILTASHEIDGFEALIRWNSPELGKLSPHKFINVAEETGFIISLGEWILRSACIHIKHLNQLYQKNYKIAVNISVIQLLQENFISMIKNIITELDFSPSLLELEITESVIMESADLLTDKFAQLRQMGIGIALDDFGTGYSSLAYLKQIPITALKVDKLFINDITNAGSDINLADIIINLGHKMNLTIIAEGVETPEQAQYLKSNGCDKIQGFYYSKPLNQNALKQWIEESPMLCLT